MGNRVKRYITDSGKIVYICVDDYLNLIGRGGDIIMCADNNLQLYVGVDEFLTIPNASVTNRGYLEGGPRFIEYIEDYYVANNQRVNMLVSQFSMLPGYIELCSMATGITGS